MINTNVLGSQKSLYLRQHANNPIHWQIWNDEVLEYAKKNNKLILVSIGYSSCHWCHVMEKEVFEDDEVAKFMNQHFVNIKVDREERPDLDAIYMQAVQLMHGTGGWPLNCFLLPNQKPIYGGTYFPKLVWLKILKSLVEYFEKDTQNAFQYADKVTTALQTLANIPTVGSDDFFHSNDEKASFYRETFKKLEETFDYEAGGFGKPPKFMLPSKLQLLLSFHQNYPNQNLLKFISTTLNKMYFGGVYDVVGGGFHRYSVDGVWKVPHFEKMLYDNAQLISVYAKTGILFNDASYTEIAHHIFEHLQQDMLSSSGLFASAIDADSVDGEGYFYTYTLDELKEAWKEHFNELANYFHTDELGYWEHGRYILYRTKTKADFCKENGISLDEFNTILKHGLLALKKLRSERIPPQTDEKPITAWNALLCENLCKTYRFSGDKKFISAAEKLFENILKQAYNDEKGLVRIAGDFSGTGFHDDYACTIAAAIELFMSTGKNFYLHWAESLTEEAIAKFMNKKNFLFSLKSLDETSLIAPFYEMHDSVIPASNSIMAHNLFALGTILHREEYLTYAKKILLSLKKQIEKFPSEHANYLQLLLKMDDETTIVVSGENSDAENFFIKLSQRFPEKFIVRSTEKIEKGILMGRQTSEPKIFICRGEKCLLPTSSFEQAIDWIKNS